MSSPTIRATVVLALRASLVCLALLTGLVALFIAYLGVRYDWAATLDVVRADAWRWIGALLLVAASVFCALVLEKVLAELWARVLHRRTHGSA
jgi:hypothetical protein